MATVPLHDLKKILVCELICAGAITREGGTN